MIIDLFSGVGGLSLGAVQAGFAVALAVENDPDISLGYRKNFPNVSLKYWDLSSLSAACLAQKIFKHSDGAITGIVGGPPCQGFSTIGKRNPKDPRNKLVEKYFEVVGAVKPKFFLVENVPGILTDLFRPRLESLLEELKPIFHITGPLELNSVHYGAATSRRRVIIIGFLRSQYMPLDESVLKPETKVHFTVKQAFAGLPSVQCSSNNDTRTDLEPHWRKLIPLTGSEPYARRARLKPPVGLSTEEVRSKNSQQLVSGFEATRHSKRVRQRFDKVPSGGRDPVSRFPRLALNSAAPTLRAGTGKDRGSFQAVRPIHPTEPRVISVREAARLQGFPDWFQFHMTKWHSFRMIGNSVPPPLAKFLLNRIQAHLEISGTDDSK